MELRIKNSETANIEIIPDGNDIIIRFNSQNKTPAAPANEPIPTTYRYSVNKGSKGTKTVKKWTAEECEAEVRKVANSHYQDEGVNMAKLKRWVESKIAYFNSKNGWNGNLDIEEQYQKDFDNWIRDKDFKR